MYPKGGSKSILFSLLSTINTLGNTLLTNSTVDEILVDENNKVKGVKLNGDVEILC